jgi:hypothetical protein
MSKGNMFVRVVSCGSVAGATCWNIRKLTPVKSDISAIIVRRYYTNHRIWNNMRLLIKRKSHIIVIFI